MGRYLVETIVLLVVMCGLAVVVLFVARRAGFGAARGPIRLVGQLPLDPRRSVYLVQVASKVLVVGVAEGGMTKLGELEAGELPTAPAAPGHAFRDVFARVLGKTDPVEAVPVAPEEGSVDGR